MLAEVNAAISAILAGGQEYKIGSKRLTRADLKQLYKMQLDLRGQVEAETKTSLLDDAYVAVFDGR
ncbi:MAG: peptidylprolyl isomerase [Blautia sp.]|nr:peptidylprolyl isomerase [Blautia sp.]